MKITKSALQRATPPTQGQNIVRDDSLKGFGVRITAGGAKTFIVEKRIKGRVRRIRIARYPELTVEQARNEAQKLLGKIATGIDPVVEKHAKAIRNATLGEVFEAYLKARKSLKPGTVHDYRRVMREAFLDWQQRPLRLITKKAVAKRHTKLGEHSPARANNAMRVLRAVFNFAAAHYEDGEGRSMFPENPVKQLSKTRSWYLVERRQSVIKARELPAWYEAVMSLEDDPTGNGELVRDYLLLLLFTGIRREEAAQLRWEHVDFDARTLIIYETKNREPHTLPMSDFLVDLLEQRAKAASSEYVFSGNGRTGHIIFVGRQKQKVVERCGVHFSLHDLRRTFTTVAESLDISIYTIKRLLNHKIKEDVTAGYIITDVERLRRPIQMITDRLLRLLNAKQPEKIIPITSAREEQQAL